MILKHSSIEAALHTHYGYFLCTGLICFPALGRISYYCSNVIGGQTEVKDSRHPIGSEVWFYFQDTEHKPSLFHV